MPLDFIHNHKDFASLMEMIAEEMDTDPFLVEKDYWLMHCLYGLQRLGMTFELKGGTSLSKGYGIIQRFSEDIDLRIKPPEGMAVSTGRNQDKPAHMGSRKRYYDWLASTIRMSGIHKV